jgi:polar amino acid transport system substrate-binding protein
MLTIRIILFLLLNFIGLNVMAEKLVIAADIWCPINCSKSAEKPGYMIEVAQHIFKKKGIETEYRIMPWARAIIEAKKGHINAVVGAFRNDAPGFIYPKEELGLINNSFFTTNDTNWLYLDNNSLNSIRLGVIKGYDYGKSLSQYIQLNTNSNRLVVLTGENDVLSRAVNMLLDNKIDVLVESDLVFWYRVNQMGLSEKMKHVGQASKPMKAYIAFSPHNKNSIDYAQILSDGILEMRSSGDLETIMLKYGLYDWK